MGGGTGADASQSESRTARDASSMGFSSSQDSSISGGRSASDSFGRDDSYQRSGSFIDPRTGGFQLDMLRQGQAAMDPTAARRTAESLSRRTLPGMQSTFNNLGALTNTDRAVEEGGTALREGLGDLFKKEIMPGIQSDALMTGGFGGGRQGVAEGVAGGRIADTFRTGLADIRQAANQTAIGAAGAQGAMGEGIFNMGMQPTTAAFGPLSEFASLLGSPAVLQEAVSRSTGRTGSTSRASDFSRSQGTSSSFDSSRDKLRSGDESMAAGFRFGF